MREQGNIKKKSYNDNYVVVSNDLAQNKDLTWEEKGMILFLQSLPKNWTIHKSNLHTFSSSGDHSTRNVFNSLVKKGYIKSMRLKKDGSKFAGWEHIFDIDKNINSEFPDCGISTCGKPTNGKSNTEKPHTTKEEDTKEEDTKEEIEREGGKKKSNAPSICTLEEATEYAKKNGFNKDFAYRFYSYYVRSDWRDSKGKVVKNWKNRMNSWMSREDNSKYSLSDTSGIINMGGFSKDSKTGKHFRVWERDGKLYQCDSAGTFMCGEDGAKILHES